MYIIQIILTLLQNKKQNNVVDQILQQSKIKSRQIYHDLPNYNDIEHLLLKLSKQKEFSMLSLIYSEIIYYNLYVLTVLPLIRLVEIVKEAFIEKYIRNIPSFPPFTEQQVQEEALFIFNEFSDCLFLKGTKNIYKYIRTQSIPSFTQNHFQSFLQFAQKSNSKDIVQPDDFRRQSSIVLKHLTSAQQLKSENTNNFKVIKDHQGMNDLVFIFIGDIDNHKIIDDPDHLLNLIQNMTPFFWCNKYMPIMHKISECIEEEDIETQKVAQQEDIQIMKLELEEKKFELAELLRTLCKEFISTLRGLNFQLLYHYSLAYSFMKFVNRWNKSKNHTIFKIYTLTIQHLNQRNLKQHFKDFKNRKSNHLREIQNYVILQNAYREYLNILMRI